MEIERVLNVIKDKYMVKNVILFIVIFIAIILVVKLVPIIVEKVFLSILGRIDDSMQYDEDKLLKKVLKYKEGRKRTTVGWKRDSGTGEVYYLMDFWVWQENKISKLSKVLKKDTGIKGTNTMTIRISESKKKNKKGNNCRYRMEFRVYFK